MTRIQLASFWDGVGLLQQNLENMVQIPYVFDATLWLLNEIRGKFEASISETVPCRQTRFGV